MFFKNMFDVKVEIDDGSGNIHIKQGNYSTGEDEVIMLTPDQIDVLISWLTEAKAYSTKSDDAD